MEEIYCMDCREKLSNDDKTCPNCGSGSKDKKVIVEDKIKYHDWAKVEVKEEGKKKPVHEVTVGDDLHRKSGRWNYKERYIYRKGNSYKEIIKDKVTGEIIHRCEEPLLEHQGHGSAKHKKNP